MSGLGGLFKTLGSGALGGLSRQIGSAQQQKQQRDQSINELLLKGFTRDAPEEAGGVGGFLQDLLAPAPLDASEFTAPEEEKPDFTLGPGATRFDAEGNEIASVSLPEKPPPKPGQPKLDKVNITDDSGVEWQVDRKWNGTEWEEVGRTQTGKAAPDGGGGAGKADVEDPFSAENVTKNLKALETFMLARENGLLEGLPEEDIRLMEQQLRIRAAGQFREKGESGAAEGIGLVDALAEAKTEAPALQQIIMDLLGGGVSALKKSFSADENISPEDVQKQTNIGFNPSGD